MPQSLPQLWGPLHGGLAWEVRNWVLRSSTTHYPLWQWACTHMSKYKPYSIGMYILIHVQVKHIPSPLKGEGTMYIVVGLLDNSVREVFHTDPLIHIYTYRGIIKK